MPPTSLFPDLDAHVRVRVETVPEHGAFDLDALARDELAKMAAFSNAERRRQFVLGRLAARRLAGRQLGQAPSDVRIDVTEDGAPSIERGFLSIAHAGRGLAAVGVAAVADVPVGVDAEAIRPRHPGLARRILRPDEATVLDVLGDDASSLTLIWALKEAVLKGQRTGLRAGAQSVRIDAESITDLTLRAWSERSGAWTLTFARQRDLWLVVALAETATGGR